MSAEEMVKQLDHMNAVILAEQLRPKVYPKPQQFDLADNHRGRIARVLYDAGYRYMPNLYFYVDPRGKSARCCRTCNAAKAKRANVRKTIERRAKAAALLSLSAP